MPQTDEDLGKLPDLDLSIIIPAYRQGARIRTDIENVTAVLRKITANYELIVVVDGCPIDTLEHAMACKGNGTRVFGYEVNRGKGYAVRFGFHQASGKILGFIDAGGDINPAGLVAAVRTLRETGSDVVVGSKRHPGSKVTYPWLRRLYSAVYQQIVRILFGFDLTDTQTGLKVFRRDAVTDTLPYMSINRFAFDVELLALMRRRGFRKFAETPVDVNLVFPSSIGGIRPVLRMLVDTVTVAARVFRATRRI